MYYNCINKAIVQTQIEDFCENYSKFQNEKEKIKVDNPEIKDKCSLSKEELRIKYASYIEDRKVSKSYWEEKQFLLTVQNAKNWIDVQELTWEKYNQGKLKEIYEKNQRALIAEKELQNLDNECKKTEEPKQDVKKDETKKDETKAEKPKEEPKKVVQKEVKKELIDQLMSKYSKQSLQKLIVPLETLRKDPKFEDRTDIIDYMLQKIRSL